jgi:uncharacterized protein (TIGR04141 family)
VTGKPLDPALGTRLTGKDSLRINAKVGLEDIADLLGRYLEEYAKMEYLRRSPRIDYVHEVRNHDTISALDAALLAKL